MLHFNNFEESKYEVLNMKVQNVKHAKVDG